MRTRLFSLFLFLSVFTFSLAAPLRTRALQSGAEFEIAEIKRETPTEAVELEKKEIAALTILFRSLNNSATIALGKQALQLSITRQQASIFVGSFIKTKGLNSILRAADKSGLALDLALMILTHYETVDGLIKVINYGKTGQASSGGSGGVVGNIVNGVGSVVGNVVNGIGGTVGNVVNGVGSIVGSILGGGSGLFGSRTAAASSATTSTGSSTSLSAAGFSFALPSASGSLASPSSATRAAGLGFLSAASSAASLAVSSGAPAGANLLSFGMNPTSALSLQTGAVATQVSGAGASAAGAFTSGAGALASGVSAAGAAATGALVSRSSAVASAGALATSTGTAGAAGNTGTAGTPGTTGTTGTTGNIGSTVASGIGSLVSSVFGREDLGEQAEKEGLLAVMKREDVNENELMHGLLKRALDEDSTPLQKRATIALLYAQIISIIGTDSNIQDIFESLAKSGLGRNVVYNAIVDSGFYQFDVELYKYLVGQGLISLSLILNAALSSGLVISIVTTFVTNTTYLRLVVNFVIAAFTGGNKLISLIKLIFS